MTVQEDVIRLKMEALGAEGLAAMEAKAVLLEGSLRQLGVDLKAGAVSEEQFEQAAREMGAELTKVKAAVSIGREIQASRKAIDDQAAAAQRAAKALWDYSQAAAPVAASARAQADANAKAAASFAAYAGVPAKINAVATAEERAGKAAWDFFQMTAPLPNKLKEEALARQRAAESLAEYAFGTSRVTAVVERETDVLGHLGVELNREAANMRTATSTTVNYASATDRASASAGRLQGSVSRASAHMTQSFVGLSRATQDFAQGGFGAIINNVEQVMSMAGPKIAGAATIIATAAYVAYMNWDKLKGLITTTYDVPPIDLTSLDGLKTKMDEVGGRIDELRKKGKITFDERGELVRLEEAKKDLETSQKAAQKVESLRDMKTEQEEKTADAFVKALKEADADKTLDKIKEAFVDQVNHMAIDSNTFVIDAMGKPLLSSDIEGKVKRLKEMKKQEFDKAIEGLTTGDQESFDLMQSLSNAIVRFVLGMPDADSTLKYHILVCSDCRIEVEAMKNAIRRMSEQDANASQNDSHIGRDIPADSI